MSTSADTLSLDHSGVVTLDPSESTSGTSATTYRTLADLPITPHLILLRRRDLELGEVLGRGRYSEVHSIEQVYSRQDEHCNKLHQNGHGHGRYVIKHLQNKLFANRSHRRAARDLTNAIADLVTEAMYLAKLRHPHIVQLRGLTKGGTLALKRSKATGEDYFLLLDRMEETLDHRIGQNWRKLKTVTPSLLLLKTRYACQMASALTYLHNHQILYRDLKPENIGFVLQEPSLSLNHPKRDRLQLFDFGLARELDSPPPRQGEPERLYSLSASGTRRYMAPEIFNGRGKYNYKADVYSWAIVFYECLAHIKPFADFTTQSHEELVCRLGGRPKLKEIKWPVVGCEELARELTTLLQQAWCQNLSERPSMAWVGERLEDTLERYGEMEDSPHPPFQQERDGEEEEDSWTRQVRQQQHFFANDPEAINFLKKKTSTSEQTSTSELTVATDPMASDSEVDEDNPKARWSHSSSRSSVSSSLGNLPRTGL